MVWVGTIVAALTVAISFRFSWLRAVADVVVHVTTVMTPLALPFAFAFYESQLARLFDELAFYRPSLFVDGPACFAQGP